MMPGLLETSAWEVSMSIGQSMLGEFDSEMQNTRKALERIPDDKWDWKPHDKSGTLGWLASHVGTVPEWITMTINTRELDYAPVDGPSYQPPKITNRKELLAAFDQLFFRSDVARLNAGAEFLEKEPHLRKCLHNRRKQKLHESSSSARRRHCPSIPVCLWRH